MIGNIKVTGTAFPFCFPGVHLGDAETTLIASASSSLFTPLSIFTSPIEPSSAMVNFKITLPEILFRLADSGLMVKIVDEKGEHFD